MKKRKIKINPGQTPPSKIQIKGLEKQRGKIRIKKEHTPSINREHELNKKSPFTRKGILYGLIGALALFFISGLIWWFSIREPVKEPLITEIEEVETPVESKSLPQKANFVVAQDTLIKSGALEQDISLVPWLMKFDIPLKRISRIEQEFRSIVEDDILKAGNDFQLYAHKSNLKQISKVRYEISSYDYLEWGMKDSLYFNLVSRKRERRTKEVHDILKRDLSSSFDKHKVPLEILVDLEKALAWKVDFFHLTRGDAFSLVFEEYYADGKFVETGNLIAARIRTQGKEHYSYLFMGAKKPGYFDEQARPVKSSFLRSPLKYSRISSHFGVRVHPIDKSKKQHRGTDYAAKAGTEIHAVASGRITAATFGILNGNFVRIDHGQGYETIYLHLQGFAPGIIKGAQVQQDQILGYVGSTGKSTGPHLCFNLKKKGKFIDYQKASLPLAQAIENEEANRFFILRDSLKTYLKPNS